MRRYIIQRSWFTLIEIIVSMTILSSIMVSVITIYISSADVALKTDINRMMQENIKNAVAHIAEDVRKNWVLWVNSDPLGSCELPSSSSIYNTWDKLCIVWDTEYYLAKRGASSWTRISNMDECDELSEHCVLMKYDWTERQPLTNSSVSIKDLQFYVSAESIPKVTMRVVLQPASWRWVKPYLIKENKLIFQTTISQRPF